MAARGLGKGLDSLIPNTVGEERERSKAKQEGLKQGETTVRLSKIEPRQDQPRKNFDEAALQELADSIRQYGLLQPLIVQDKKTHYEIIAGERRWRAAKLAGLKEVPVIIRDLTEQESMEISLIENIQRENLNPIEEAEAYRRLVDEFNIRQEDLAERVSKSRTAVTNTLRLLKLDPKVRQMVEEGSLSAGHARALLSADHGEDQVRLAEQIVKDGLSVREAEKLVRNLKKPKKEPAKTNVSVEAAYQGVEEQLKNQLKRKVSISHKANGSGKIQIEFYNTEDLEGLVELLSRE